MTEPGLSGVGEELRRAREAMGLAVSDVAQQLKFVPRQIEALEQERFKSLAGPTIARGMVRNYARLLKLDPEPLLERIVERLDVPDSNQLAARYRQPVPFSDSTRRSTLVYLGLSLGILGLVGAVAYEWHRERSAGLAFVPAAKAPLEPPRVLAVQAPAPPQAPPQAQPQPQAKAQAREREKPATAEDGVAAPAAAGTRRIIVRCEEESWIEVRDGADRLLVASLNPAGTERVIQGQPPFSLVIGNAQHVRLIYGDREVDLQPHTRVEVARLTLK